MLFAESSCQHAKVLGLQLNSFFWTKYNIFLFFNFLIFLMQKGVWPYRYAYGVFLVTLIQNLYGSVI